MKFVVPVAKNATTVVMAPVRIAGPAMRVVVRSDSSQLFSFAAELQIARDIVRAVVDSDADERGRERDAQNIQMTDGERGVAKRPSGADQQDDVCQQGVAHAAESGDDDNDDADQRDDAAPGHRRLAGLHFVVFHDRQTGEADFDAGMPQFDIGNHFAQGMNGFATAGQFVFADGDAEEDEAHASFFGDEIFGAQFAQDGQGVGHIGQGDFRNAAAS